MNARTVSGELRSRRGWTDIGESIQRGYGLGADRAAGQILENLSKGGMVWEQTVYRKGFLPCCMLAASAVKAPRLAL